VTAIAYAENPVKIAKPAFVKCRDLSRSSLRQQALGRIECLMIPPAPHRLHRTLNSRLLGFARRRNGGGAASARGRWRTRSWCVSGVSVFRRALTEGALIPRWCRPGLRIRDTDGAVAATAFAGRVLASVSLAMAVAAALIGVAMPLVINGAGAGLCRPRATLQLAVECAAADAALSRLWPVRSRS